MVGEALPEVYGRIGPTAIPALAAYIADATHNVFPRIHAVESLERIGQLYPTSREACVKSLMGQLENYKKNGYELNAFLIHSLVALEAVEAAPLMARAFEADLVDESLRGDWEDVQMDLGLKPFRERPELDAAPFYGLEPEQRRSPNMGSNRRGKTGESQKKTQDGKIIAKEKQKAKKVIDHKF